MLVNPRPSPVLPPYPHLPSVDPAAEMDWRVVNSAGPERGEIFFERCLTYAHYLWQRGLAARAVLAADRALLADLRGDEPILAKHPLPYRALAWMIGATPLDVFIGNPRVHYQHLADRVRAPRRDQRATRAWACWHLARAVRPDLPGDPRHAVREPSRGETAAALDAHGIPGERETWQDALESALAAGQTGELRG